MALRDDAVRILHDLTRRDDATFRPGQFEAIEALVRDQRRVLVVQRTGWGKSAVYFVAGRMRRQQGFGPTLIVSPLLSLMRDQVAAAQRAHLRAAEVSSNNTGEWQDIFDEIATGDIDLLLVSPERLVNPRFRAEVLPRLLQNLGLLVIDEAHCISDWGHDFRPDYRRIRELIAELPADVPVLATTATANERVVDDVAEQLSVRHDAPRPGGTPSAGAPIDETRAHDVLTLRGALARESLRLGVLRLATPTQRLGWLLTHLHELPGSGIIYTLTVSAANDTARLLAEAGLDVVAYSGQTSPEERRDIEDQLKENRVKAVVATSALGMGFDKPDLGFVVHFGAPSSPVAYYQQIGRAGRAVENADVLLLPGAEDKDIWAYFATASMPSEERAEAVLGALADGPRTLTQIEAAVDLRRSPLQLLLKVLAVEGAVEQQGREWALSGNRWVYDAERYRRVAQTRESEQEAMLAYERTTGCRMKFLTRQLDDPNAHPCGRCDACLAARGEPAWYPADVPPEWVTRAQEVVSRAGVVVTPRKQWPSGLAKRGVQLKGKIPEDERPAEGRVIARLTDLGHGQTLRALFAPGPDGRPQDQPMPEALRAAIIEVLRAWDWQRPAAVVSIPSATRPELVRSTAAGIATMGRMVDLGSLDLDPTLPQPGRGNSTYRVASIWGRVRVPNAMAAELSGLDGPVLLVDDRIDTGWTMTVVARELLRAGCPGVLPFALALEA